jgi:ABC-2 type transport system permease protein
MTGVTLRPGVVPAESLRRLASLTWTLAVTEWRLRFYGSVFGYLWSLARPFALFGVIYVVFAEFAKLGESVPHYPVYILFGLVLFQFFIEIAGNSVQSMIVRENLLRKVRFPRLAVPLSIALSALFNLGMMLIAVMVFAVATGVTPQWGWLELPLLIAVLLVLGLGAGMLMSVLFVRYRDVQPIWDVFSQALFYGSPVLYVVAIVPASFQQEYMANPIAAVLTEMRHAILDPNAPSAAEVIGGTARLLVPAAIVVITFALGWWAFRREAPRIAENL